MVNFYIVIYLSIFPTLVFFYNWSLETKMITNKLWVWFWFRNSENFTKFSPYNFQEPMYYYHLTFWLPIITIVNRFYCRNEKLASFNICPWAISSWTRSWKAKVLLSKKCKGRMRSPLSLYEINKDVLRMMIDNFNVVIHPFVNVLEPICHLSSVVLNYQYALFYIKSK